MVTPAFCPSRSTTFSWFAKLAVFLLALTVAACSQEPEPEGTVAVNMYDNGYSPPRVRIPVGGRVVFRNMGRNQHHAVALDESWSTEASHGTLIMERGESAEVTFESPGVYPYYCTYHGSPKGDRGMVGLVLVGDVAEPVAAGDAGEHAVTAQASARTLRVPQDFSRIQQAVDAALPGDLVLIDRGVYVESVRVTTPSVVLRGVDRNEVILDGDFQLGNGVLILADGVAVENLTARHYTLNGFYWTGVTGYRGSHLTAYNNGDYGIYAFDSTDGLIEDSYASGHPDAGFYVGQCYPCRAVLRRLVAENNALGYSGTNAGGELYLVDSIWRDNLAGIVPNTLDTELLPPERETTIVGNVVIDNDNLGVPVKALAWPAQGTGILIAGGRDNLIERNLIAGHRYGVLLLPSKDDRFWPATGNLVRDNRFSGSRQADLAEASPGVRDNCFAGNRFESSAPARIETLKPCRAGGSSFRSRLDANLVPTLTGLIRQRQAAAGRYRSGDWRRQAEPPLQPSLDASAAEAVAEPAVEVFAQIDLDLEDIPLPELETGTPTNTGTTYGTYRHASPGARLGAFLERWIAPFAPAGLALLWAALALIHFRSGRRRARASVRDRSARLPRAWLLVVLIVPWLGALVFLACGRGGLSRQARWGTVAGSLVLLALCLAIPVVSALGGS